MVQLVELEVEGFRSFKGRARVVFPTTGSVLISGHRTDSPVSSGTGKSSLLLAIAYGLGFSPVPATELKNWSSKNLYVKLLLKDDSSTCEIIRDPKLTVTIDGQAFKGTDADSKLKEWLKVDAALVQVLTYRPQRTDGSFLLAPDATKKELLTKLLGLDAIEKASESAKLEASSLATQMDRVAQDTAYTNQMLASANVTDASYQEAEAAYVVAQQRLNASRASAANLTALSAEISAAEAELNRIVLIKNQVDDYLRSEPHYISQVQSIEQQVSVLKSERCYVCQQSWSAAAGKIDALLKQRHDIIGSIEQNRASASAAQAVLSTIPTAHDRVRQLHAQRGQLSGDTQVVEAAYRSSKGMFESLVTKRSSASQHASHLASLLEKQKTLTAQAETCRHASDILGKQGFLGVIFDELLGDIEMRVNKLIADFPNLEGTSVQIVSTKEGKTGNVKQAITVKVIKNEADISVRSLSGGQVCGLDLCFDLAMVEAIRSRTGSRLGWLALDEAMDGLDVETKRHAIEVIRRSIRGLIVFVDHATEIKESFESVVRVVSDGVTSMVEV